MPAAKGAFLKRRNLWIAGGLLIVLLLGSLMLSRPKGKLPTLPSPNGYEDFLKAAEIYDDSIVPPMFSETEWTEQNKKDFLEANREALRLIEAGLSKEVGQIHDLEPEMNYISFIFWSTSWKLFVVRAELEDQFSLQEGHIQALRYSRSMRTGGDAVQFLRGIAMEEMILNSVVDRIEEFEPKGLQELIEFLMAFESEENDIDEIVRVSCVIYESEEWNLIDDISFRWNQRSFTYSGSLRKPLVEIGSKKNAQCREVIKMLESHLAVIKAKASPEAVSPSPSR